MNMRGMRHEYIGGCILGEALLAIFLGLDLAYLFACPLSEAHMGSRHCTAAAVL